MKKIAYAGRAVFRGAAGKIFLCMKISILFLLIAMQVSATNYAQQRINLDAKNVSVLEVLKTIEDQSSYRFNYSNDVLPADKLISIHLKNAEINSVLTKMFEDIPIQWSIVKNKNIVLSLKNNASASALLPPVNGHVTNDKGEALVGASIIIKGSTSGTTTDANGNFTLNTKKGDVLVVSAVGYATQEIIIANIETINITLLPATGNMDEVVVIGYGSTTKRKTTSAISTVDVGKVAAIPSQSISDGLTGRVNGLIVTASYGAPGAKSQISIRGGGPPIFVIDGVIRSQNDYENINPNDIADMSFLKDAAATAVYGQTATNGVVVITTKKGVEGKPAINYSFNQIWTGSTINPVKMSSYDKAVAINKVFAAEGKNLPYADSVVQFYKDQSRPYTYPNTDWRALALRGDAPEQRHDLSFSTGTKITKLFSSLSYYDQRSILRTDANYNKRITYRLNTVSDFENIHLKVTTGLDGFIETNSIPNSSTAGSFSGIYSHIQNKSPMQQAVNEFGLPSANTTDNPVVELSPLSGYGRNQSRVSTGLLNLDYAAPFLEGLHFKFNGSYNMWAGRYKSWNATAPSYGNNSKVAIPANPPSLYESRGEGGVLNLQWFVTYSKTIKEHAIDFTGVYETRKMKRSGLNASRQNYQIIFDQFVAGPTVDQLAGGSESESARASYIGRLGYNFKQRYFIEGSFRYDASDFFPPNNRWGLFPAVSASYIISDEAFMQSLKDNNIFNLLKLRGSYGITGTRPVTPEDPDFNPFLYVPGYSVNANAWVINGKLVQGSSEPGTIPSITYSWYNTTSRNIGLDFASFNNRLTGSFDYFYNRTTGYTGSDNSRYSGTLGVSLPTINITKQAYRRAGTEFIINWGDKIAKDFTYKVGANFTYFNELWEYYNEDSASLKNPYTRLSGVSRGFLQQGYINSGFYTSNQQLLNGPRRISSTNVVAGDLMYQDLNGDGKIDASDFRRLGNNVFPRINFGFTFDLGYKGAYMSTVLAGSGKRDRYMGDVIQGSSTQGILVYEFQKNYWTPDNTGALYPRQVSASGVNGGNNYVASDFWFIQSGYLRLKFLQLGYDLKYSLLKNISTFKTFKVFVSGTNLWTRAKSMKYFIDPESDPNNYNYPIQRTVSIGANIGF